MNKFLCSGRMTKDPDVRYTTSDSPMCIARGSIAINRRYAKDGEQKADFPNFVAFGKTAEFFEKYVKKGTKLIIEGRLQTGSYEKDGVKHYTTDIVVEQCEFAESKASAEQTEPTQTADGEGFIPIQEELNDENLPFL